MRRVPDWAIQSAWWASGIFATGAVWYFLSVQNYLIAAVSAVAAIGLAGLAVFFHRRNDTLDQPQPEFMIKVGEEVITFTELVRSLEYDIIKINAHTHALGVMAEYRWILREYPEWDSDQQALSTLELIQGKKKKVKNPVHFDVLDISHPDGRTKKIYFDISQFFGGGGSLMDPQSAVAHKLRQLPPKSVRSLRSPFPWAPVTSDVRPQNMRYSDGSPVALGDLVDVPVPSGTARARVVMLGDTYEHLDVESGFLSWVNADRVLRPTAVVIEWPGDNPFAHDDPKYAPVGNYMFTDIDEHVIHAV